jgi:hypothetical protein
VSYGGGLYSDNVGGTNLGNNLHVNFNAVIEVATV